MTTPCGQRYTSALLGCSSGNLSPVLCFGSSHGDGDALTKATSLQAPHIITLPTHRKKRILAHLELGQVALRLHSHASIVSEERLVHVLHLHRTRAHLETVCVFLRHRLHLHHLAVFDLHRKPHREQNTCRTVQGILVHHLSHRGIIPIFRATTPVRLEVGLISPATN